MQEEKYADILRMNCTHTVSNKTLGMGFEPGIWDPVSCSSSSCSCCVDQIF
jgi:hypothetical protein